FSVKFALLDYDDTLLATFDTRSRCIVTALGNFGYSVEEAQIAAVWGSPFQVMINLLAPQINFGKFYPHYQEVMKENPPRTHPGAEQTLSLLSSNKIPVLLLSSSSHNLITQDLEVLGL